MQYQVLTDSVDCLINIIQDIECKELVAEMLCCAPTMFGDNLFVESIYPEIFRGSIKEEAVDFFKGRVNQ